MIAISFDVDTVYITDNIFKGVFNVFILSWDESSLVHVHVLN